MENNWKKGEENNWKEMHLSLKRKASAIPRSKYRALIFNKEDGGSSAVPESNRESRISRCLSVLT